MFGTFVWQRASAFDRAAVLICTALLTFGSMENFKSAEKAHGREVFADIANFTNAKAVVQINDILA